MYICSTVLLESVPLMVYLLFTLKIININNALFKTLITAFMLKVT